MPIDLPLTQEAIFNRSLADFQGQLPDAGPFLRNSFTYAMLIAFAARSFDNYQMLKQILIQMFPDSATDDYLERWGGYIGVNRNAASIATGNITATGTVASSIPIGTQFQTTDAKVYQSIASATIASQTFSVASMSRSGNTVTVNTTGNHQFATGVSVTIAGAVQTDYNGTVSIVVTSDTQFTYSIATTPATPATGTITATFNGVTVVVNSVGSGSDQNLDSGTQLSLVTPLTGIDSDAYVQFDEIVGGQDSEDDDSYRARVLYKYQHPVSLFNVANITAVASEVPLVSRVFVQEITPHPGQVTVYIVKDASTGSVIPTSTELTLVKNQLLTIKPAHMDAADLFVSAPTAVPVNFTFTSLTPNTVTMQNAILASLTVLFNELVGVGSNLLRAAYESTIYQTVDLTTGASVSSFALSAPAGDVSITSSQIPTLGTVTFS